MLDTLAGLELRINPGGGGSYNMMLVKAHCVVRARNCEKGILPAAAAGSTGDLEPAGALSRDRGMGLRSRSRPESGLRGGGERDRRSNRDARRGSGSV